MKKQQYQHVARFIKVLLYFTGRFENVRLITAGSGGWPKGEVEQHIYMSETIRPESNCSATLSTVLQQVGKHKTS